jgi:hypothetical protein
MNSTFAPAFVPNPPNRGTLGLVWQSVFTYFLCLWTAVHPDIVSRSLWPFGSGTKLAWGVTIFFIPELAFGYALGEFFSARNLRDLRNKRITSGFGLDGIPLLQYATHSEHCPARRTVDKIPSKWGMQHAYLAYMGGLKFKANEETWKFPTSAGIERMSECNILPTTEYLTARITARARSDYIAKTLVCAQVTWFVIQTVARKVEGLPVTPLEINTLAQVWCALVCYSLWWFKPQDITEPVEMDYSVCETCQKFLGDSPGVDDATLGVQKLGSELELSDKQEILRLCGVVFLSGVYLGIHATGWNWPFPTFAETILWRTAVGLLGVGIACTAIAFRMRTGSVREAITMLVSVVVLPMTTIAFIVEAFVSLRRLPVGSYLTPQWLEILPHIG